MNAIEWTAAQPPLKRWRPTSGVSESMRVRADRQLEKISAALESSPQLTTNDICKICGCKSSSALLYIRRGHDIGLWQREKRSIKSDDQYRRIWVVVPV